jgi:hypothetical protein
VSLRIIIDVDIDDLNIIFSTSGHIKVDKDYEIDQLEFNKEDNENEEDDSN